MNDATPLRTSKPSIPADVWHKGDVKWFDRSGRRFGFIIPDDDTFNGADVFFSWQVLDKYNIKESRITEGARVEFRAEPPDRPGRRPRAVQIRPL